VNKPPERHPGQDKTMRLGIISALHEEQQGLVEAMERPYKLIHGMREYFLGQLWEIDAVCVLSRIGKVAAATDCHHACGEVRCYPHPVYGRGRRRRRFVRVGDIVVAESLVQHDMDASPLFPRYEVPLTGLTPLPATARWRCNWRMPPSASWNWTSHKTIDPQERAVFALRRRACIGAWSPAPTSSSATGSHTGPWRGIAGLLAVEMEGAAVAQVCFELGIPFGVIRTISDNANENAATDFMRFVKSVAAQYAFHIVRQFCRAGRRRPIRPARSPPARSRSPGPSPRPHR
jgi:adenosylhomocysteine nucleosidase